MFDLSLHDVFLKFDDYLYQIAKRKWITVSARRDYFQALEQIQWLREQSQNQQAIIVYPSEHIGVINEICSSMIIDLNFSVADCSICHQRFRAQECLIENWDVGSDLFGRGGRLLRCPQRHILFINPEWIS